MNLARTNLVAERGRAVAVSYRGVGSANGNRTRIALSDVVRSSRN